MATDETKQLVKNELKNLKEKYSNFKIESGKSFPFIFSLHLILAEDILIDGLSGLALQFSLPEKYPQEALTVTLSSLPSENVHPDLLKKLNSTVSAQSDRMAQTAMAQSKPYAEKLTAWLLSKLKDLIMMYPEYLDMYISEGFDGSSQRRFTLKTPAPPKPSTSKASTSAEGQRSHRRTASDGSTDSFGSDEGDGEVYEGDDRGSGRGRRPSTNEDGSDEEISEEDEDEEEGGENTAQSFYSLQAHNQTLSTTCKGITLAFEGVTMKGISLMECHEFSCIIHCARCNDAMDIHLTNENSFTHSAHCTKCQRDYRVVYYPAPIMENSHTICSLELEGCIFWDTLPSKFHALCFECSNDVQLPPLRLSQQTETTCEKCFSKLSFMFHKMAKQVLTPASISSANKKRTSSSVARKSAKRFPKIAGLTLGEPLPAKGTCKHYRHSLRWLRFPCCGKAYPCDICHDLASDHECEWATRMICGLCSSEQRYHDYCRHCKQALAEAGKMALYRTMSNKEGRKKTLYNIIYRNK